MARSESTRQTRPLMADRLFDAYNDSMSAPIDNPKPPPVTDSPWFWITLFCCAALVVLVVAEGQVDQRQVRIERQTQGRQRAAEMKATGSATTEMSSRGNTRITTAPLILLLAVVLLIAGNMFWLWRWKRFRTATTS